MWFSLIPSELITNALVYMHWGSLMFFQGMNPICIDPLPPVGSSVVVFFAGLDVGVDCHA